jgi:hypothetical protein
MLTCCRWLTLVRWNALNHLQHYTTSQSRSTQSIFSQKWEHHISWLLLLIFYAFSLRHTEAARGCFWISKHLAGRSAEITIFMRTSTGITVPQLPYNWLCYLAQRPAAKDSLQYHSSELDCTHYPIIWPYHSSKATHRLLNTEARFSSHVGFAVDKVVGEDMVFYE